MKIELSFFESSTGTAMQFPMKSVHPTRVRLVTTQIFAVMHAGRDEADFRLGDWDGAVLVRLRKRTGTTYALP